MFNFIVMIAVLKDQVAVVFPLWSNVKIRIMNVKRVTGKIALFVFLVITAAFLLTGCDADRNGHEVIFEYDFRDSPDSWEPFFTGFNAGWEEKMKLDAGYRTLPEPLETEDHGHFISATNMSDDVKMLFRKQVDGLEPNSAYRIRYTIRFATEVPSGCAGIGGAPGEAVKVIANASIIKPQAVTDLQNDDYYVLNIQYLHQDPGEWYQNAIMGDIANSRECDEGYQYEIKEVDSGLNHNNLISDENGRAWLLFGTRSGFEGQTDLYYTYFKAVFSR